MLFSKPRYSAERILSRTRALLSQPGVGITGAYAKTDRDSTRSCPLEDGNCFCLVGALARVTGAHWSEIERVNVRRWPEMYAVAEALEIEARQLPTFDADSSLVQLWDDAFIVSPTTAFAWLARAHRRVELAAAAA